MDVVSTFCASWEAKLTMSGGSNAFLFKEPIGEKSPIISHSLLILYSTVCNLMLGSKKSKKGRKIVERNFQLFFMLGCGDQVALRKKNLLKEIIAQNYIQNIIM